MKMKRAILANVVFAFAVAILIAGCAQKATRAPGAGELKLAVIGKSVHPYWGEVEVGTKAAAKELGVRVDFFVPPKEDAMEQSSRIRAFASSGAKGIAFAASDPTTVLPAVKKAIGEGIVCIALDTDAPKSGRLAYVGTDNYTAGRLAGEAMGKILNGKGKVLVGTGSLTATNSLDRMRRFEDVLKEKFPGIKIVEKIVDSEDSAAAVNLAKAALVRYDDVNGFFGVYAINGPAAATAVKAAKKVGEVHIVCFDTTPEHMNGIKAGVIDATVGQRPYMMGYKSVKLLKDIIEMGKDKAFVENGVKDQKLDTGVDVVTKADLESYRAKLKEMGIPVEGW